MANPAPSPMGLVREGGFSRLASLLDPRRPVAVQTHDFPDLDAVASAWGLALLLDRRGFAARPCHRGKVRSRSLARLVAEFGISLVESPPPEAGRQIIVVDGSPSNGNIDLVGGELIGVIDHHRRERDPAAPYLDIQPELASCSTLIYGYWADNAVSIPTNLGTAFLAGIQSDSDFLSRRASPKDFAAYSSLFEVGDFELASRIVRTVFDLKELDLVTKALVGAETNCGLLFAWLPGSCSQEVLAVLAEFILRTEELRIVVIAECDEDVDSCEGIHLSARSKDPALSAFSVLSQGLAGIGTSGGHSHSAGGFIPRANFPGPLALRRRFLTLSSPPSKEA